MSDEKAWPEVERRRRTRWWPEMSEDHRRILNTAALIVGTFTATSLFHNVIGTPQEIEKVKAEMLVRMDSLAVRSQRTEQGVQELKTDVRVLRETSFSSKDAQDIANAVSKLTAVVEGLDVRIRRLEDAE